jgi:large subunit ribosomal protein L22
MAVKAIGRQVGISTKRVRPMLQALKGMNVSDAIEALRFQPGPTAESVSAVLRSAAANAENNNAMDPTRLKVVNAYADQAVVVHRFRARSRGRVGRVRRQASHITIEVDEQGL